MGPKKVVKKRDEWHYEDKFMSVVYYNDEDGTKFAKARARFKGRYDHCPVCGKIIKKGPIVLTVSNHHEWLPNLIMHTSCVEGKDPNCLLPRLRSKYKSYKRLSKIWAY